MNVCRQILLAALATLPLWGQVSLPPSSATLQVDVAHRGAAMAPGMWGIFFEDINFAADGGLWAERVKNRSFEFPQRLQGWFEVRSEGSQGTLTVREDNPAVPRNPHYLRLQAPAAGYGVGNEGFRGMGVRAGEALRFSLRIRGTAVGLGVSLRGDKDKILAQAVIEKPGAAWSTREVVLTPTAMDPQARLELRLEGPGQIDLDAVSLMPAVTWKGHGFRPDLAQLLADLKPGFLRFPGGCIVEGQDLSNRYAWKETVDPKDERRPIPNRWLDAMANEGRGTPDYQQSFQLGFFEYFQLAEDLGADPLPVLNCGMACQFQSCEAVGPDELAPYIQDALDLIEFATGPANSRWGKVRAEMGHPAPFRMPYLAVGNEQWGPEYIERFPQFAKAIRAKAPGIQLVGSSGPWSGGRDFNTLWAAMRREKADLVDEHYYAPPGWFLANAQRYDAYPRTGPKVFAGEFAAHPERPAPGQPRPNTWEAALSEAAFMTGLERNADVVRLASYAPLLGHVDAWQWSPNLIWFDNLQAVATPSYWVQSLFSRHRGTHTLPVQITLRPGPAATASLYASATLDEATREVVLKVVNASPKPASATLPGLAGRGRLIQLAGDPASVNALREPPKISPIEHELLLEGPNPIHIFPPHSLSVLRISFPGKQP